MSKDYVTQLEATIQNLRRDNSTLKEENAKYKDLENKRGCPLEVVVKAQVSGFYGKTKEDEFCFYNPVEDFIIIDFRLGRIQVALSMDFYNVITFYLSDYQKTWFLRKDKSE